MANLERSFEKSPYHYCSLCGRRRPLADMTWELGALVCAERDWCSDKDGLLGYREKAIAQVLRNSEQEMAPDKKLTSPAVASSGIEEIIL